MNPESIVGMAFAALITIYALVGVWMMGYKAGQRDQ